MEKLKNLRLIEEITLHICKWFGHKWRYYTHETTDLRFCVRCKTGQIWKKAYITKGLFWSTLVQYRELGAKKHVTGYGKE